MDDMLFSDSEQSDIFESHSSPFDIDQEVNMQNMPELKEDENDLIRC